MDLGEQRLEGARRIGAVLQTSVAEHEVERAVIERHVVDVALEEQQLAVRAVVAPVRLDRRAVIELINRVPVSSSSREASGTRARPRAPSCRRNRAVSRVLFQNVLNVKLMPATLASCVAANVFHCRPKLAA